MPRLKGEVRPRRRLRGCRSGAFFLGRQSWLAEELLEPAEIPFGVTMEPRPQHAGPAAALEAGAHLPPTLPIGSGQIASVPVTEPGGEGGDDPHRTTQHGRRGAYLAAGHPPLVAAV